MPESIFIQIGQCGNQIGNRFWEMALREHATYNKKGEYDRSLSSFFRNISDKKGGENKIIVNLKARGILIDMEEGVINSTSRSRIAELFDENQKITSTDGCGNNFAAGHEYFSKVYRENILEAIRIQCEECDTLQSFFITHSMGGGTGSGIGSFVMQLLSDYYPDVYKIGCVVFPGTNDDVITSPYNRYKDFS